MSPARLGRHVDEAAHIPAARSYLIASATVMVGLSRRTPSTSRRSRVRSCCSRRSRNHDRDRLAALHGELLRRAIAKAVWWKLVFYVTAICEWLGRGAIDQPDVRLNIHADFKVDASVILQGGSTGVFAVREIGAFEFARGHRNDAEAGPHTAVIEKNVCSVS
jgi:hypothetical protein